MGNINNNNRKQVRLSEKRIDEAINDVLKEYMNRDDEQNIPEWYSEFMDPKYSDKSDETPDYNENILDFNTGRYAMLSQSDDDWAKVLGQTKRPTMKDTMSAVERYYNDKLDESVENAIRNFFGKS